jgi:prephenate dehydrogenase
MNTITVGIVGLGRIGVSLALALRRYARRKDARQTFRVTGFDVHARARDAAKAAGALDAVVTNPAAAARERDIVLLSMPLGEAQEAYRLIGPAMRQGGVLLDFAPLTQPGMAWAAAHLPPEAHRLGVTAVVNPAYLFDGLNDAAHAAADLFDGGVFLLTPGTTSNADAVQLASDLAEIVGARTRFADPAEHDGWQAALESLPALLGAATFYALRAADGWDDARRAVNPTFGRFIHPLASEHPDDLRELMLHSREQTVRYLDVTLETLHVLRDALLRGEKAVLDEALRTAAETYHAWWAQRQSGDWDNLEAKPDEGGGSWLLRGMLGSALADRLSGRKRDS